MKYVFLRIRNLPCHKILKWNYQNITFQHCQHLPFATCKNWGFRFSPAQIPHRGWLLPRVSWFTHNCTFCQQLASLDTIFNTFYLGKQFSCTSSCRSCSKGNLHSRPRGGFALCHASAADAITSALGTQRGTPASWHRFTGIFLSGAWHLPPHQSDTPPSVATLCGKTQITWQHPFQVHNEKWIKYFLPAACNQESWSACFLSGFWFWLGMKERTKPFKINESTRA